MLILSILSFVQAIDNFQHFSYHTILITGKNIVLLQISNPSAIKSATWQQAEKRQIRQGTHGTWLAVTAGVDESLKIQTIPDFSKIPFKNISEYVVALGWR